MGTTTAFMLPMEIYGRATGYFQALPYLVGFFNHDISCWWLMNRELPVGGLFNLLSALP